MFIPNLNFLFHFGGVLYEEQTQKEKDHIFDAVRCDEGVKSDLLKDTPNFNFLTHNQFGE